MMKKIYIVAMFSVVSISALLSVQANASSGNATIFPPVTTERQECGPDQLRVLSWAKGSPSTICLTGQEVMALAIPTCGDGQQVVKAEGKFTCRPIADVPECGANEALTHSGGSYACVNPVKPTCGTGQVVAFNGSSSSCVPRSDNIPTCSRDEYLTHNGTSFQCATVNTCEGGVPAGAIMPFNRSECPTGWREYKPAYGRFIRGIDRTGSVDPDGERVPGSLQDDSFRAHTHGNGMAPNAQAGTTAWGWAGGGYNYQGLGDGGAFMRTNVEGGEETRPKNVVLLYCEKE